MGSSRPPNSTLARKIRSVKPVPKEGAHTKWASLDNALAAFADAYALISVASAAIDKKASLSDESMVLRKGVEALDRAYNQLDEAIIKVSASREAL